MSGLPKDDDLDRMVEGAMMRNFGPPHAAAAHTESIEPSSGFAASVMERVRSEAGRAASFGPIQFPWMRAIPGICMALLALLVSITMLVVAGVGVSHVVSRALLTAATQGSNAALPEWAEMMSRMHLGWLLVALAIAFVPLMISRSLVSRGHRT